MRYAGRFPSGFKDAGDIPVGECVRSPITLVHPFLYARTKGASGVLGIIDINWESVENIPNAKEKAKTYSPENPPVGVAYKKYDFAGPIELTADKTGPVAVFPNITYEDEVRRGEIEG